ncbi:hypothetical protein YC2023_117397 [Brassica napus]
MRRRDGNGRTHLYGGSRQHSKPYHRNVEQRLCAKQYNGSYNMRREDPASGSQATIIPDGSDINSNSGNDQHVAQHIPDTCLNILASCDRYSQGKAFTFIFMVRNEVSRGECQTGFAELLTS